MMPNHETSRVTLELTPEQARHLQESIVWSKNATEKAIEARPHDPRPRAKWGALDDIAAQLEETKREEWYGNESDHGSLLA